MTTTHVLVLAAVCSAAAGFKYNPGDYIHTLGATNWGLWGTTDACEEGSYAYGFELQVEAAGGITGDDTALNAIKLFCRTPSGTHTGEVTSATMDKGNLVGAQHCHEGFLYAYDLKSQAKVTIGDNTAANDLNMWCTGDPDLVLEGHGDKWGKWLGRTSCRKGMAICGIMTRVQEDQGILGDDTALNDVKFLCCDLPTEY